MTDMLVRPLADNRMLRASGGADLTTTLGQSLGAVFDTPMMTGLVGQSWSEATAGLDAFTEQQRIDLRQSEFDRQQETSNLEAELDWSTDDRRDEITLRLGELSKERNVQIQAETQRSLDEGRLQEPESLNELYGELDLNFDRPMTAGEASLLADNKRAEMIRQSIISKGPSGLLPGVAKFGAGLAAMAVDPLEVASMFIPVVGLGGRTAAVARFGKVGGRVIVGATEGFVGSALTEPIYFGLSRQQQLDYTMADALLNVGLGTIFGGGIGAIGGVLARADVPVAARVDGEPIRVDMPEAARGVPEVTPTRIDPAVAAARRVEADVAIRQFVNDQSVDVESSRGSTGEGGGGPITVYHGTYIEFEKFDLSRAQAHDESFAGVGTYFTNVRALADEYGKGVERRTIEAKIDLQRPIVVDDYAELYKAADLPIKRPTDPKERATLSKELTRRLEDMGHDGVVVRDFYENGDPAFEYVVFDPDRIEITNPRLEEAKTASRLAKNAEVDPYANPEAARVYDEYSKQDFTGDTVINEDIQMYDAMVKQIDELTPEQRVMVDEVTEMETRAKSYADISRVAATCMART